MPMRMSMPIPRQERPSVGQQFFRYMHYSVCMVRVRDRDLCSTVDVDIGL